MATPTGFSTISALDFNFSFFNVKAPMFNVVDSLKFTPKFLHLKRRPLDSLKHGCRSIVDNGLPEADTSQQSRKTLGLAGSIGRTAVVSPAVDGTDRGRAIVVRLDPRLGRMMVFRECVEVLVELAEALPEGHVQFLLLKDLWLVVVMLMGDGVVEGSWRWRKLVVDDLLRTEEVIRRRREFIRVRVSVTSLNEMLLAILKLVLPDAVVVRYFI